MKLYLALRMIFPKSVSGFEPLAHPASSNNVLLPSGGTSPNYRKSLKHFSWRAGIMRSQRLYIGDLRFSFPGHSSPSTCITSLNQFYALRLSPREDQETLDPKAKAAMWLIFFLKVFIQILK